MTTVAISKNKRTQVLFHQTPPLRPKIIIAFDHDQAVEDMIFLAQIDDESLQITLTETLCFDIITEIEHSVDDDDLNHEVCG